MAKKTLSHIYPKDIRVFLVLAKTGAMNKETLNNLNISNTRIHNMVKANIIKEVSYPVKHGTGLKSAYELTNTGKSLCKDNGIHKFISNGQSTRHNESLSSYLVESLTKAELQTCLSERELKGFIEDKLNEYYAQGEYERYEKLFDAMSNNELSMPDILYVSAGQTFAIECITETYTQTQIDNKIMTCELLNIEITFVKAT
ncbi:hypothetical protein [[Clostridium] fimetarium]|uniref:Uncharacterized protein n=1 Tax=[Clostridium] fimetarium TaxID=99656 RepID=A0A1I0QWL4_9FIRM|nr:hypothetical protein [[Clostridium] fimetarium]SEW31692.1 hypothetical protein SAMN05421659_109173 [[Clostridium] fimetarium]